MDADDISISLCNFDASRSIDIHNTVSTYIDPGPTVYAGGVSRAPLASGCTGYAAMETPTKPVVQPTLYTPGQGGASTATTVATTTAATTTTTPGKTTSPVTTLKTTTTTTSSKASATTTTATGGGCSVAKYAQCGGTGWTGCTSCVVSISISVLLRRWVLGIIANSMVLQAGSTCQGSGYYYQCL